jgi:hypothetical protein
MALMVDEQRANVVVYGRDENGIFANNETAFHAWVECDGWLIDFTAPSRPQPIQIIVGETFAESRTRGPVHTAWSLLSARG